MQQDSQRPEPDFSGLTPADWGARFRAIGDAQGFYEPLGRLHAACFVDQRDTLLVTFETLPRIQRAGGTPLGFRLRHATGWSSLTLVSKGDTWFRSPSVAGFFDQLRRDAFFDDFERVLFYGAGPGGYAACSYARACPGARVLALAPQATLDPRVAGWDPRFRRMRRLPFGGRYGFAPDGLRQAAEAWVLFDPQEPHDAMHAALFDDLAHRVRTPFLGPAPDQALERMGLLQPLLEAVAEDRLTPAGFARMMRARRDFAPYLRRLLAHLDAAGRPALARVMCRSVLARREIPSLRAWLERQGE